MQDEIFLVGVILASAFMAAVAQYIFKRSMPAFRFNIKGMASLATNKALLLGVAIYLTSLAVYLFALRGGELSFVYPTFASVFIFVLLISKFLLGERISLRRALGVLLIVIGIAVIAITY